MAGAACPAASAPSPWRYRRVSPVWLYHHGHVHPGDRMILVISSPKQTKHISTLLLCHTSPDVLYGNTVTAAASASYTILRGLVLFLHALRSWGLGFRALLLYLPLQEVLQCLLARSCSRHSAEISGTAPGALCGLRLPSSIPSSALPRWNHRPSRETS